MINCTCTWVLGFLVCCDLLLDVGVDLLSVLVESNALWRSTVSSTFSRSYTDNVRVNSARDAIMNLDVEFWQCVFLVD